MKKTVILIVIVLILVLLTIYTASKPESDPQVIGGDKDANGCLIGAGYSWCAAKKSCLRTWEEYCTSASSTKVIFSCTDSKKITAKFYSEDDKYVDLVLNDGTMISLPHATSASGARYAKPDESFVFWNKGDTAFITENGTTTYSNCYR